MISIVTDDVNARVALPSGHVALLDASDVSIMDGWCVRASVRVGTVYVECVHHAGKVAVDRTYLHRLVMCPSLGMVVDHINGDGLDNRRANLRVCTQKENSRNQASHRGARSRFRGVTWSKQHRKWAAQISTDKRKKHLGLFDDEELAARAYDRGALALFGDYARLNFRDARLHVEDGAVTVRA